MITHSLYIKKTFFQKSSPTFAKYISWKLTECVAMIVVPTIVGVLFVKSQ